MLFIIKTKTKIIINLAESWLLEPFQRLTKSFLHYDTNRFFQGKSILKRRLRNERAAAAKEPIVATAAEREVANTCKRFVTFDETITVKNERDLVIKKPLKLELVIDHWKSSGDGNAKNATDDEAIRSDSGIVKRLVDEFNAVQDVSASGI